MIEIGIVYKGLNGGEVPKGLSEVIPREISEPSVLLEFFHLVLLLRAT